MSTYVSCLIGIAGETVPPTMSLHPASAWESAAYPYYLVYLVYTILMFFSTSMCDFWKGQESDIYTKKP